MAELIRGLRTERVAANLAHVREVIADAAARGGARREGRPEVEVLAATKYVAADELPVLAQAGVELVGENRAQDMQAKIAEHGELFTWDFIGALQSRRVRLIVPHVRLIHSVASRSALAELRRHAERAGPGLELLIEVNVSGEPGKAGISPLELPAYLEEPPFPVTGLMTMPPLAGAAEDSRPWFRSLRELADRHGLPRLSMGTSQDYAVAVEEGATIVRIGTSLYL